MGQQAKLLRAYIQGCNDTWALIDDAIKTIQGIGPKTQDKLMKAIKAQAAKEIESVNSLSTAERHKLMDTIDRVGGYK